MRVVAAKKRSALLVCLQLTVGLLALGTTRVHAAEHGLASPHTEESNVIVGAKGMLVGEREAGENRPAYGGGVFVETTLLHDRLELELALILTTPGDTPVFAIEPLLKLPLHIHSFADPYIGVGGVFFRDRERGTRGGVQAVVGSYVWLSRSWGIDADITFAVVPGRELIYELACALGPVARF